MDVPNEAVGDAQTSNKLNQNDSLQLNVTVLIL